MTKAILRALYLFVRKGIRNINWYIEMKKFCKKISPCSTKKKLSIGKYLILIPHSDDEWIGCSTLIVDPKYDVILCNMDMSGNDSKEIHLQRRCEIQSISTKYNKQLLIISGCKDHSLAEIIRRENPTHIAVPYILDWHPEHFKVMGMLDKALNDVMEVNVKIVMYQVTIPIQPYNITHVIPMDKKQWHEKWIFFKDNYKTQKFFPWYRVACQERINGAFYGKYACEAFCEIDNDEWLSCYRNMKPSIKDQMFLSENNGSLIEVRKFEQKKLFK